MDVPIPRQALAVDAAAVTRRVRLLGQPQLSDYLDFVREKTVGGEDADVGALVDEWRAANDLYHDLEESEAGLADAIEILSLDRRSAALARQARAHPRFKADFAELPTEILLVELDKLVVSQLSVALDFCERLAAELGPNPSAEALFRFCLPLERERVAPVEVRRLDDGRFHFASNSSDFRALEPALLSPARVHGLPWTEPLHAVLGVGIGFGANFLQAIRADDRLILQNGYHRAYALRSLGVTHAVCAVQTVTRRDELKLVASGPVAEAPEFYCLAKRPPLLKDYFDPRLRKILHVRRMSRLIEVSLTVRELQVVA